VNDQQRERLRELADAKEMLRRDERWRGLGESDRRERAAYLLAARTWVRTGRLGADDTAPERG
jgi:hypothetical protein